MPTTDTGLDSFRSLQTSPQSKRNTKNLSLQLNKPASTITATISELRDNTTPFASLKSPLPQSPSTHPTRLYRHPSLSRPEPPTLVRRATLSLSIPTETETSRSSAKLSSNSIPSFSSSSPMTASPIVPETPEFTKASISKASSHSSSSTLALPQNDEALKTQTLIQHITNMDICRDSDGDTHKMNAYPDGPVCVLAPYLFLYSEPTLKQVEEFDIVVNVAKELSPPILKSSVQLDTSSLQHYKHKSTEYFYVPWTHTSKLGPDLPLLTQLILDSLQKKKKVLVHCQCGVSRSASLIVACLMKLHCVPLNDAYNMLKERAPDISPNMSLIFQLMEWGEFLGVNPRPEPGYSPIELGMDPLSFEGNKMLS